MHEVEVNKENFEFLSNLHSKHLNCKICSLLMLEPIRLHSCGHTFCQECVGDKKIRMCPICTTKIEFKQKDILANKLVGELPVRCLSIGCPWEGAFEEYSNFHQQSCKLKNGGIDVWLKELQNTISENTTTFGNIVSEKNKEEEVKINENENLHMVLEKKENEEVDDKKEKIENGEYIEKKHDGDMISTRESSGSRRNRKSKRQNTEFVIKPELHKYE